MATLLTHSATSANVVSSTDPATRAVSLDPSDTVYFSDEATVPVPQVTRGIIANVSGTITVRFVSNKTSLMTMAITAGVVYPFAIVQLRATDTDAAYDTDDVIYGLF